MNGRRAALLLAAFALAGGACGAEQDNSIAAAMNDLQVRVQRDLPYGPHPRQRLDAYLPGSPRGPILLVVHGGAWHAGDKASPALVVAKVRHWTARGFVVVSTNYRLLPQAAPLEQARDVARALALVQRQAREWGADPQRVVLVGHSAGAHLVSLLNARPAAAYAEGARPWRGTVSIDNPAMDVPAVMRARHARLFDRAFGADPSRWADASPVHLLAADAPPLLAICSSLRPAPCAQAEAMRAAAAKMGRQVVVLRAALGHAALNQQLGVPGDYSASVDRWISSIL